MRRGDLNDKVAIVTGGGSGIGRAVCFELAEHGCRVVVADMNYPAAKRVRNECRGRQECLAVKVDVSRQAEVRRLFDRTLNRFNGLDILVNSAGLLVTFGGIEEVDEKTFDRIMNVNLKGVFLCCQQATPIMKANRSGKIVNISSISAKTGGQYSGLAYPASKAGVICLTKSIAQELAPYDVNVNCIAPGIVDTPMVKDYPPDVAELVPLKRKGRPEEIAYLVHFLVSDEAAYITGETIDINGGILMD